MSTFPISRFSIKFQAFENIQLPRYAGSTLRGAFGHALKSLACLTASRNKGICKCEPAERCLYRQLFDPPKKTLACQNRVQDIAPPFVIEAHSLPEHIQKNETAGFYMIIIGQFAQQQQMMIQLAWQRALAEGIGINLSKGGMQSQLLAMTLCNQPALNIEPKSMIKVDFLTHTRLQHHGKLIRVADFNIQTFAHALLRRYLSLAEVYSDFAVDAEELKQLYEDIAHLKGTSNLEWVNWSRYSSRQKQKMNLDGLMGTVQLDYISERLFYYLYLGQWLHVGKGCVFGLGHYTLRT